MIYLDLKSYKDIKIKQIMPKRIPRLFTATLYLCNNRGFYVAQAMRVARKKDRISDTPNGIKYHDTSDFHRKNSLRSDSFKKNVTKIEKRKVHLQIKIIGQPSLKARSPMTREEMMFDVLSM